MSEFSHWFFKDLNHYLNPITLTTINQVITSCKLNISIAQSQYNVCLNLIRVKIQCPSEQVVKFVKTK